MEVHQDLRAKGCLTVDAVKNDTIQTHPTRAFYFNRNTEEQEGMKGKKAPRHLSF